LLIASFAEMVLTDDTVRVDEVQRRPVVVVEGVPDLVVIVDSDRIVDPPHFHRLSHAVDLVFERELRGVDTDDDQSIVSVCLRP
jgi:hypothetical protein